MVKIKIAFYFAMLACIFTAFSAISEQARIMTILYRVSVSILIFGLLGYFATNYIQQQVERKLSILTKESLPDYPTDENSPVGQNIKFSPLTAENLEHITEMK